MYYIDDPGPQYRNKNRARLKLIREILMSLQTVD